MITRTTVGGRSVGETIDVTVSGQADVEAAVAEIGRRQGVERIRPVAAR